MLFLRAVEVPLGGQRGEARFGQQRRELPRGERRHVNDVLRVIALLLPELFRTVEVVPIPLIPPCDSEGSRHRVPGEAATPSERSDAGDFSSFS